MNKRIKEIRKSLKLSQKEFGEQLGVSRDVIANIEYGRVEPQPLFVKHLCSTFNVNPIWLETGEGEIFLIKEKNLKEAIELFDQLIPSFQDYAISQIEALLELQKKEQQEKE